MCVPFGKILRDVVVPNTVTKAIYTEKVYTRDASASRILADDILHKGDRIKKLYPM